MAREDLHFRLRIPEALKARIETAAKKQQRSMTAEIIHALEAAYPEPRMSPGQFFAEVWWQIKEAETLDAREKAIQHAKAVIAKNWPDGEMVMDDTGKLTFGRKPKE